MIKKTNFVLDVMLAGIIFLMVLMVILMSSCKHEPDVLPDKIPVITDGVDGNGNNNQQSTCDPDSVYFQTQILPLLVSNCAKSGCHSVADHQDGVILNSYSNVMSTADVDAGRADHSKLYEMITETDPDKKMPPDSETALTPDQISLIFNWIEQGARNNTCENNCDTNNVTFSATISPLLQGSCVGCHSGATPGGQINLASHQGVATVALNGKLYGAVSHGAGFQPMPRGGNQLQDCQIDQIRIWIANGAPNN